MRSFLIRPRPAGRDRGGGRGSWEPVSPLCWRCRKPQALLCTNPDWNPAAILTAYLQRWLVEITFQEARIHLGMETQCQ